MELLTRARPPPSRGGEGSGVADARGPRRGWRSRLARIDIKLAPYLLVSPYFLLFAAFGGFPLIFTFWVSLHNWELIGDDPTFAGLGNYLELMTDTQFWNSVLNTFGIFVVATVPQLVMAMLLANALNHRLRGQLLYRLGVMAPIVTSVAAVAIVFSQLFGRDFGMINWALGLLGIDNINWSGHRWSSWLAIAAMVDWRWTGYNALIYLAAMQSISKDLYEAAAMDGASRARQFWSITVPMLRPAIIFTVILATIGGLQLFTEPLLFAHGYIEGGSLRQFQTTVMYVFENAFERFDYGYGSAVVWVLFLLIILVAAINYLITRRISRAG